MGTNYVVPQTSPFKINGVSSLMADDNISLNTGINVVTITDLGTAIDYVSSINSIQNAVSFAAGNVGIVITTIGGNQVVFTPRVAEIYGGSAKAVVTPSGATRTINFF